MPHRYKLDLHTHSIISYDGGINEKGYEELFTKKVVDCLAITDHNDIRFARAMQKKFGQKVIIGEEIDTADGQLLGLFLKSEIPPSFPAKQTCQEIHAQGGLVYIPHPFEKKRWSMQEDVLEKITKDIDIIEVFNARGFLRGKPEKAEAFAKKHGLAMASSSDAHGYLGVGSAYSIVSDLPTKKGLIDLLKNGSLHKKYANIFSYLTPTLNKLKRRVGTV